MHGSDGADTAAVEIAYFFSGPRAGRLSAHPEAVELGLERRAARPPALPRPSAARSAPAAPPSPSAPQVAPVAVLRSRAPAPSSRRNAAARRSRSSRPIGGVGAERDQLLGRVDAGAGEGRVRARARGCAAPRPAGSREERDLASGRRRRSGAAPPGRAGARSAAAARRASRACRPAATGITAWPRIGPESSSGVTSCTVQPCTAMPAASARAWVSRPGKSGRIEGWTLSIRPAQRGDEARRQHPHEAGEAEDLGAARAERLGQRRLEGGAVAAERRGGRRRRSAGRARRRARGRRRRAGWRAPGRPRPGGRGRPCRARAPACSSRRPRSGSRRAAGSQARPRSARPRPAATRPITRDRLAGRREERRRAPRRGRARRRRRGRCRS